MKGKAVVKGIQFGGFVYCHTLEKACRGYSKYLNECKNLRTKMIFVIELPNGEIKQITIRDEDGKTVAYGDFEGLPSFLEYAKANMSEIKSD